MPIKNREKNKDFNKSTAFITFDPRTDTGRALMATAGASVDSFQAVARNTYKGFETNITVRDDFSRDDYEYFRPKEALPRRQKEIISYCMEAYRRVGIVRNIIDLMGDFCVQGISLVHANRQQQKVYRGWAKKVKFKQVSERAANLVLRAGNVVMKRAIARLPSKEEDLMKAQGEKLEPDTVIDESLTVSRRNLPVKYTFLNPATLEIIGGELSQFVGKQVIALRLSGSLKTKITNPKNEMEQMLVDKLPSFLTNAVKQGKTLIPLEQDKLITMHYKKDDWQEWADPMTYAILDDIILLEKMKLADLAALDGAISQIRLWTLGDLDKGIFPTDAAIDKLAEILASNPGGGAFDLIWGPELKFQEHKTDVHKFLGAEKYEPVLSSIHAGLGVPPTLTGSSTAAGTTNNFISIQTMVQRLEYVRDKIRDMWTQELELVRQALGYQKAPQIQFDRMILNDEAAEKALLLQLWDRNVISDEVITQRFGEIPELEQLRTRREERERERGLRNEKTGPYFTAEPDKDHEYKKIALQNGFVGPEDMGMEPPKSETPFDKEMKVAAIKKAAPGTKAKTKKGKSGQGRPKTSKSGGKSKRKFKIRTSASEMPTMDQFNDFVVKNMWAKETQKAIADMLNPHILSFYQKKNLRELSEKESGDAELLKFNVLANMNAFDEINEEGVLAIASTNPPLPLAFRKVYDRFVAKAHKVKGRDLTTEERKVIQTSVYSILK